MNQNQKFELLQACETGNHIRIVTIALQIAATLAREGDIENARNVRRLVDDYQMIEERKRERMRMRDEFAKAALVGIVSKTWGEEIIPEMARFSYEIADSMLEEREVGK